MLVLNWLNIGQLGLALEHLLGTYERKYIMYHYLIRLFCSWLFVLSRIAAAYVISMKTN